MHFLPARAKSQSKQVEYVFSLRKPLSTGKPGKSDKSEVTNSVFSGHSSKLKSLFSSFENLRGIVRPLKLSEVESLSKPKSLSMSKKRTVPQRFFNANLSLFPFPTMPANDRGYGLGRSAGEFPVARRQRKCGRKDCKKHISRPKRIGVCYGFGVLSYSLFSVVLLSAMWLRFASKKRFCLSFPTLSKCTFRS